jgi:hypothetical protein
MLTLALLLTIQNHVTFEMMPFRSSTPIMAATPWWTKHSHKLATLASMQKWYDIDSIWQNMMILRYLARTSPLQSSKMTRSSSPCLNSWLTPEVLQELAPPSSLKSHCLSPPPNASSHHPNLNPLAPAQKPRITFPQLSLAKALWTSPLPLSYYTRMGSLHMPSLPQTTMGLGTRSSSIASAKFRGMTRQHAQPHHVTFAPLMTTPPSHACTLTSVARTIIAGSCSATLTTDSSVQLKST